MTKQYYSQSKEYRRERYAKDKKYRDRRLQHNKTWKKSNPVKVRVSNRNRKSLVKSLGSFTSSDISLIREEQGNKCPGCLELFNKENPDTIDHFVPISKGGTNTPENIQLLCQSCNCSKKDTLWVDWMKAD